MQKSQESFPIPWQTLAGAVPGSLWLPDQLLYMVAHYPKIQEHVQDFIEELPVGIGESAFHREDVKRFNQLSNFDPAATAFRALVEWRDFHHGNVRGLLEVFEDPDSFFADSLFRQRLLSILYPQGFPKQLSY